MGAESLMAWGIGGLAVVIVGALAGAWTAMRREADPVVRRLRATGAGALDGDPALQLQPGLASMEEEAGSGSRLRRELVWAGIRRAGAPQGFVAAKVALAVVALTGFAALNALRTEPVRTGLPMAALITGLAFFLPNLWLRARVEARQTQLDRSLPDALDLLVTCVEAGLGLDSALQRVSDEVALAHPLLSKELRLVFLEVKAGIPRIAAFRRMAERTGAPELRSLSATLAQTELFGTSVGAALRVQAEGIRIRRMHRAEEKAAYVSVKMSLPLVLCILPCVFAVVLGPAVVNMAERLFPLLGGGR
ncbi:type II secretion system F family protein [Anaeromyxobacter sp. PSR-1]|uniref:type II secretion system F family protein n=1 Tax=unclassified Anaeromyxobacter TaxID=2620896 RepID=UPI0005E30B2C|nr:type II secretion system F family protein [Anaeromyxobacter sp. PSR-1]GAO02269.1 bacterial type II secretion system protein F domain protein [Anaeromyxobacter sp. PSR-1]